MKIYWQTAMRWMMAVAACAGLAAPAGAADWIDNFEDGKVDDGSPVSWTLHPLFPGDYFVEEGDFHLAGASLEDGNENLFAFVASAAFEDVSVRAQGLSLGEGNLVVGARMDPETLNGYLGLIDHGGLFQIIRSDFTELTVLIETNLVDLGLDATDDVLLQLDVFGSDLSLTAWRPGDPMPEPQLTVFDDSFPEGVVGLLYNEDDPETSGVYRFAQASSLRIVDLLAGDANGDGKVDLTDFGILKDNFGTGTTRAQGDFNADGKVDLTDFGVLKDNFGKLGAAAVPEPSSLTLAAVGLAALAAVRRRLGVR